MQSSANIHIEMLFVKGLVIFLLNLEKLGKLPNIFQQN